ncbi:MAG: hypothetical protein PUD20_02825 [bacterium]|nr:hypothetical protein [bacterium]
MNIVLLLLLITCELVLAIFTLKTKPTKTTWLGARAITSCTQLVGYLIFILFPGIDFGFRFKVLFIILLIRAILSGIVYALKHHKASDEKRPAATIVSALLGIILISVSMVPSFLFRDYTGQKPSGSHEVATTQAILVDSNRIEAFETDGSHREVPVYFFYPSDMGDTANCPLVIFSHGAFGYYQSNMSTYQQLASNGYVVVSLDHPYHSFFTKDTDGKTITVSPEFFQNVMYINSDTAPEEEICRLSGEWMDLREDDMNFALDTIKQAAENNQLNDVWKYEASEDSSLKSVISAIDCDKIGLMGHSLGGATSVSLGQMRSDIDAVIDLDGTMLSMQRNLVDGMYVIDDTPYPVPLLSIDNEEHHFARIESKEQGIPYANNVVLDNAREGFDTYFAGAGHMNYTDLPLFAPFLANMLGTGEIDKNYCVDTMNELVLQFFNCYLMEGEAFTVQECYE